MLALKIITLAGIFIAVNAGNNAYCRSTRDCASNDDTTARTCCWMTDQVRGTLFGVCSNTGRISTAAGKG